MKKYDTYSDEQLVRLLQTSHEAAFEELYDRYWKKVFFIGVSKLNNLAVVEELVQDIFCDLWARRESLQLKGTIGAYIAVAIKYKIINYQAKQKREAEYEKSILTSQPEGINSTELLLSFEQLQSRLSELVDQLPEQAKLVFHLNKIEGLPHKEIAAQMNISPKAVERSIARSLQSLAAGLKHFLFSLL